jgi:hypothetical protein
LSFVYCPECGFQNPEAANYCAKCGALLVKDEGGTENTQTFTPEELAEEDGPLDDLVSDEPALVVRSGGGRTGEHFIPTTDRASIGRSPDCEFFLDDVTVSRKHAVLIRDGDEFRIEDQGSLNGTYVNRRRIETATRLQSGDEVQIGKYRMSFITK